MAKDRKIKEIAIIGLGALGMMYGELISKSAASCRVSFVMDAERQARYSRRSFYVNGQKQDFNLTTVDAARPPDLLLVATKYDGLNAALELADKFISKDTIIISVLNGISSEEIIARRFGWQQTLGCVAIGMDAMRQETTVSYTRAGRLQLGVFQSSQEPLLRAVAQFCETAGLAFTIEKDIRQALWAKFLLNVGINQACMVFETTYGGALQSTEIYQSMVGAMQEVILIAQKEKVNLTKADLDRSITILRTLSPAGFPSMRQDALARRPSEVELFAGTVLQLAARHKVAVPVNEFYYQTIRKMEEDYRQQGELDFTNII